MNRQKNETLLQLVVKDLKENCTVVYSYEIQD